MNNNKTDGINRPQNIDLDDVDYGLEDKPLEDRYPFPGRGLPSKLNWDHVGWGLNCPSRSPLGRRRRQPLIPISPEVRDQIISELKAKGEID